MKLKIQHEKYIKTSNDNWNKYKLYLQIQKISELNMFISTYPESLSNKVNLNA
jgi:hypothetical protein